MPRCSIFIISAAVRTLSIERAHGHTNCLAMHLSNVVHLFISWIILTHIAQGTQLAANAPTALQARDAHDDLALILTYRGDGYFDSISLLTFDIRASWLRVRGHFTSWEEWRGEGISNDLYMIQAFLPGSTRATQLLFQRKRDEIRGLYVGAKKLYRDARDEYFELTGNYRLASKIAHRVLPPHVPAVSIEHLVLL